MARTKIEYRSTLGDGVAYADESQWSIPEGREFQVWEYRAKAVAKSLQRKHKLGNGVAVYKRDGHWHVNFTRHHRRPDRAADLVKTCWIYF